MARHVVTYLIDTSAYARIATSPEVAALVEPLLVEGAVAVCGVLALEVGFSARSGRDHARVSKSLAAWPWIDVEPVDWLRASDVQGRLAEGGQHRAAGLADLLTAAAAERSGVTVLHYDRDFELIAEVSGQPTQWVIAPGSVD